MITIPLDGPSILQRRATILTDYGLFTGIVLDQDDDAVLLVVEGRSHIIDRSDIRTIAAV